MADYEQLAEVGRRVRGLLDAQSKRPYVLEITGTPKAGKTSAISMIESFFKACDWRVHVVRERAEECPIPMKGHFFFNTWTTCTMLAEVLDVVDRDYHLVILDRGFFDALVWLELQCRRGQVTKDELEVFQQFVLLPRWRQLVDVTVLMSVPPDTAMKREQYDRLVPRRGSVMQKPTLQAFNEAVARARTRFHAEFSFEDVSSENDDRKEVAAQVVRKVVARIETWVDPRIAVVPRQAAAEVFGRNNALSLSDAAWRKLTTHVHYVRRSAAELDDQLVQIVAGGVAKRDGGVFVFDRSPDRQRVGEYGKDAIWRGEHIEEGEGELVERAQDTVSEHFQSSLHLRFELTRRPLGVVWTKDDDNKRAKQHLGVLFEIPILDEAVAESLEDKEFRTSGRGHPAKSRFVSLQDLSKLQLESWSRVVVSAGWLGTPP